jgi:hypothetical protein
MLHSQQLVFVVLVVLAVCWRYQDGNVSLSEMCRVVYQNKFEK